MPAVLCTCINTKNGSFGRLIATVGWDVSEETSMDVFEVYRTEGNPYTAHSAFTDALDDVLYNIYLYRELSFGKVLYRSEQWYSMTVWPPRSHTSNTAMFDFNSTLTMTYAKEEA
uniref:Phage tail protein n=1 Tax=Angiostrongylus cantonensis TaxID=6313 RepID=A0A0K0DFN1_ANGCA